MESGDLLQRLRQQRLTTLMLADQIKDDRWREPALTGSRSIHEILSHILAWDEWAIAVFEISAIRPLPPALANALQDVDGFNARAIKRFRNITRDDLLSALQTANTRLIASARQSGGADWATRRIADLARLPAGDAASRSEPPRAPSVRGLLRLLIEHEESHAQEIMDAFSISTETAQQRHDEAKST